MQHFDVHAEDGIREREVTGVQTCALPIRDEIVQLLPSYSNAKSSKIFAENFFDDYDTQTLSKEATDAFSKLGKITKVGPVVPENQLRGYFNLDFEKGQVQISFTLTPENPALIQEYHFKVKE